MRIKKQRGGKNTENFKYTETKMSDRIIIPPRPVYIVSSGSCVGKEEAAGPLGKHFDFTDKSGDDRFNMGSFEKAEAQMQRIAIDTALGRAAIDPKDADAIFSGDLQNQCAASAYATAELDVPHFGLFGACSTSAEALTLAAIYVSSVARTAIAVTSSHNCTAERQFRFPLDYGAQRPQTAQWTVTGAGAFVVSSAPGGRASPKRAEENAAERAAQTTPSNIGGTASPDRSLSAELVPPFPENFTDASLFPEIASDAELAAKTMIAEPKIDDPPAAKYQPKKTEFPVEIAEALAGISRDFGINDGNDMGAAMAPAACDTLVRYFRLSGRSPSDFDLILTGDLGIRGKGLLADLLAAEGFDASDRLADCGAMIYDAEKQDKHAGGSGCGCSAAVLASYILPQIGSGELSNVLFVATGALMNPLALMQGENIVGIAHLIRLRAKKEIV